jgi:hypothetical protein
MKKSLNYLFQQQGTLCHSVLKAKLGAQHANKESKLSQQQWNTRCIDVAYEGHRMSMKIKQHNPVK